MGTGSSPACWVGMNYGPSPSCHPTLPCRAAPWSSAPSHPLPASCFPQYEVSEDSFFQNMLNFYNFSAKVMADQLRKPPNRDQ